MAKNYRSRGDRVTVTAAAARTSGSLVIESQIVGVCVTTAALGGRYALIVFGEVEIPLATGAAKGDQVFISTDGVNTVGRAPRGTALGVGTALVGRVTGIPGDPNAQDVAQTSFPAPGFMTVRLAGIGVA